MNSQTKKITRKTFKICIKGLKKILEKNGKNYDFFLFGKYATKGGKATYYHYYCIQKDDFLISRNPYLEKITIKEYLCFNLLSHMVKFKISQDFHNSIPSVNSVYNYKNMNWYDLLND